jgi:lipoate-protein ligase B
VATYLVLNGFALDYVKYSQGKYAREEARAKRNNMGLWSGEFIPPWQWRAEQHTSVETTGPSSSPDCKIKANISREGRRTYHVPGQRDYNKTKITESKGERWFCSEVEAKAAGWSPAKR